MSDPIAVVDHDPGWAVAFPRERKRIDAALGQLALDIEHHGSTAVPGLAAKPILDVMVAVQDLDDVSEHTIRLLQRAMTGGRSATSPAGSTYGATASTASAL